MKSITIKNFAEIPKNYTGHVKHTDGAQVWYKNGKLHREDGPAEIWVTGERFWYKNGKLVDAPKAKKETMKSITVDYSSEIPKGYTGHVKYTDGTQEWLKDRQLHREDGPAVINLDGTQVWYKNGIWHREDGPSIIYANGTQEWYKNGRLIDAPETKSSGIKSNPDTNDLVTMYKTARKSILEHQCKWEYWEGYKKAVQEMAMKQNIKLD